MNVQELERCQRCDAMLINHHSLSCMKCGYSAPPLLLAPNDEPAATGGEQSPNFLIRRDRSARTRVFVLSDASGDRYRVLGRNHYHWVLCLECLEYLTVCSSVRQAYNHAVKHHVKHHG